MMTKTVRFLLGLNAASFARGCRLGFKEFIAGCFSALSAVRPFQDRGQFNNQVALEAIPEVTLGEILGQRKCSVKLNVQAYEDGMLPNHEAMALLSILVAESPREILEIGTFMGHTTRAMTENLPGAIVHTVDLPPDFSENQDSVQDIPKDDFHLIARRVVGREFKGQEVECRIKQHLGDTAKIDFKNFGVPTFFFIDGSHTYEYCKQDSEKCLKLCADVGVYLWHDCDLGHPGVVRFVNEWRAAGRDIVRIAGTSIAYWKGA